MLAPIRQIRRPRPRTSARLLATIAFVAGFLSLQLGQLSHSLFVKHGVCEHGDLVHIDGGVDGHTPKPTLAARTRSSETEVVAATAQGAGHEHCDGNAVRAHVIEISASLVLDRVIENVALEPFAVLPEQRPIAVLWLAPKNSPPRG